MKQVIIVSAQFPPCNLTAGHRSRYFAMHLEKFGWKARILTAAPSYYEEKLDYELERLISPGLEVIRTKALSVHPVRLVGDIGIRAFWWHYLELCRLARKTKVDLIYIPIPPNYSALLGALIYRKFKIAYAIDYIDPWVHPWPECKVLFSKAWFSFHLNRLLEPIALKRVSLITAVAPGYYSGALQRYPWLKESDCLAIPYGAEEYDFRYLEENPRPAYLFDNSDGNFHLVYAGAMLPKAYSTLDALLKALIVLFKKYPWAAQRIRLHFIGTGSDYKNPQSFTIKPIAKKYNLSESVCEYPARIPYLDTLNHLKASRGILILGSSEAHYTPSKVFQAILARRAILALLHVKSTAVELLKETNAGLTVTFDEDNPAGAHIDKIAEAIYKLITEGYSPEKINWEPLALYSAQTLTGKLAAAFDRIA